jgi:hypothetical protein
MQENAQNVDWERLRIEDWLSFLFGLDIIIQQYLRILYGFFLAYLDRV